MVASKASRPLPLQIPSWTRYSMQTIKHQHKYLSIPELVSYSIAFLSAAAPLSLISLRHVDELGPQHLPALLLHLEVGDGGEGDLHRGDLLSHRFQLLLQIRVHRRGGVEGRYFVNMICYYNINNCIIFECFSVVMLIYW